MDALTEKIAQELTIDMIPDGIWRVVAREIGTVNTVKLFYILNGDTVYAPKPEHILVPARNNLILREFTGYNCDALARKYSLTTGYVLRLCKGKAKG
ncbi:MAG: hypothetical protein HFF84_14640 [Oscillibacter sp.]|nr:hypothetical protein [Oscillibacter sp.]